MAVIFLTGATGFVGGFLAEQLSNDGHEVYGLVRWTSEKKHYKNFKPIFGDLRDYHILLKTIRAIKPKYVYHLAAISPVSYSFENPFEYMEVNTTGTINLAEINLRHNKRLEKFIFAGTPEEYGLQDTKYPIKEDAPLRPASPYGVSKVAADLYLQYMHKAYEFPVTILRHTNCYGRRDQTHFVIESIVTQMLTKEEILLGDPYPVRDFIYISDVVDAYLNASRKKAGLVYNFGWGKGYSIKEVVEMAQKLTGFDGKIHWNTLPKRALEIPYMTLDAAKAWKELQWTPDIGIVGGLKKVRNHWLAKLEV